MGQNLIDSIANLAESAAVFTINVNDDYLFLYMNPVKPHKEMRVEGLSTDSSGSMAEN